LVVKLTAILKTYLPRSQQKPHARLRGPLQKFINHGVTTPPSSLFI